MSYAKSSSHAFSTEMAQEYGVDCAIVINHFQFWINKNIRAKRNFHEGRTWSYETLEEIAENFPYWTVEEVREILDRLCAGKSRRSKGEKQFEPVLKRGNFNKSKFDRTCWYSFHNEEKFTIRAVAQMEEGSCPNPNGSLPRPIPDTIPDTETVDTNVSTKEASASPPPMAPKKKSSRPKEDKIPYRENVNLTEEQHAKLLKAHPSLINDLLDKLSTHKAATGKAYLCDYSAILNWVVNAVLKDKQAASRYSGPKVDRTCYNADGSNRYEGKF